MSIITYLFLLGLFLEYVLTLVEINQAVFLNPKTNSTFIQCPLHFTSSLDIQWYDVNKQQYDPNRGRYYRIHGLQTTNQELICSSVSNIQKIKFIIQIYDHPLPIEHFSITKITNTSLTTLWKDNPSNQNANVTSYELILKYDHLIQSRLLINYPFSTYTFSSLYSSTFYSIDLSVVDIWKRTSPSRTILVQTLPFKSQKKIFYNKIIDENVLDQSISCYDFDHEFLFIEFNQTNFQRLNHIYNFTLWNDDEQMLVNEILYSSWIYPLKKKKDSKYKIQFIVSTIQSKYLGKISKDCRDFSPPITCSIRLIQQNQYHLMIYKHHRQINILHSNVIFYSVNQSYVETINISEIYYVNKKINDVKENYSIIVKNELLNEIFNISIVCFMSMRSPGVSYERLSNGIIISFVLFIALLVTSIFLIAYRKLDSFDKSNHRTLCYYSSDDVSIEKFEVYVSNMHRENNWGFRELFASIDQVSNNEHSRRVQLATKEYINANYVDGYEKINTYIVIQGPMIDTINDFWRMIWEKDVGVIVMMTNTEKYDNSEFCIYWPEEDMEIYGELEITLVSKDSFAYYIKRTFIVRCTTNPKFIDYEHLVHQFHYTDWPDHGVPLYSIPIISFIRRSSFCHSQTDGPMVVHCSAGISPTGTYIVIDTMLKKMNEQSSLAIPSFLKRIRQQRCDLVQTAEQFIFIYDVLLEAVELFDGIRSIEKQFQLIRRNIGQEGMNASYIHGYYRVDEFIITEHPMMDTRIDFWRMIWDNQTEIIVALYADENLSSDVFDYWSLLNQIIDCGDIHVGLMDERFEGEYIYRDCLIRSIKENGELRVRIISNSYWPEACSPVETSFHLINTIRSLDTQKPMVVHDFVGGHRAATFCALYTMKEQMEHEGILNVYELAKFYHLKRPGIWRDSDDLLFLYRCAKILLREYNSKSS